MWAARLVPKILRPAAPLGKQNHDASVLLGQARSRVPDPPLAEDVSAADLRAEAIARRAVQARIEPEITQLVVHVWHFQCEIGFSGCYGASRFELR